MSAKFVGTSSQYLSNPAAPILDYPLSVGMFINPDNTSTDVVFSLHDTASDNNFLSVVKSTNWVIAAAAGGATSNAAIGVATVGTWHYVVGRFISSSNRKLAILAQDGSVSHATTSTARAPTSMDAMSIGARADLTPDGFLDGLIAEFWITNTDIQSDGAQLIDATMFQLACGGPFSVPHIGKDIIEYRSFRKYPSSEADEIGEVYHGGADRQTWTNTNGVTIGPHPPLPYWYEKPGQNRRVLTI